jgi:hypothetical protein
MKKTCMFIFGTNVPMINLLNGKGGFCNGSGAIGERTTSPIFAQLIGSAKTLDGTIPFPW